MKQNAVRLALLAAVLMILPGVTALSTAEAPAGAEAMWAPVKPAMSVVGADVLTITAHGWWCSDKPCFSYCGPSGGTYIGGGGVPCICC